MKATFSRTISILLLCTMLLSLMPVSAFADEPEQQQMFSAETPAENVSEPESPIADVNDSEPDVPQFTSDEDSDIPEPVLDDVAEAPVDDGELDPDMILTEVVSEPKLFLTAAPGDDDNAVSYIVTTTSKAVNTEMTACLTGGGEYAEGDEVTVTAYTKSGYYFLGWYDIADTGFLTPLCTEQVYTFTVTADVDLVALYEVNTAASFKLRVYADMFKLNGENHTEKFEGDISASDRMTVEYTNDAKSFLYWYNASKNIVTTQKAYSFYLGGNSELTALAVDEAVEGESANVIFRSAYEQVYSQLTYTKGGTLEYPNVNPSKMGYDFTGWYIADATGAATETAATADALDALIDRSVTSVIIVPGFTQVDKTYTINVTYPDGVDPVQYPAQYTPKVGEAVELFAPEIEGKTFSYWSLDGGNTAVSYATDYKVLKGVPCVVNVTAVYDEAIEQNAVISINETYTKAVESGSTTKFVISNVMQYYLPDNCTLVASGFVYGLKTSYFKTDGESKLYLDAPNTTTNTSSLTANSGIYTLNVSVPAPTNTLYIRGYVTYIDGNGATQTIYSSMVAASYNSITGNTAAVTVEEGAVESDVTLNTKEKINAPVSSAASVPAGTKAEAETTEFKLSITETEKPDTVAVTIENANYACLDINITGVSADNESLIRIALEKVLPVGLANVEVFHSDKAMTAAESVDDMAADTFVYDAETGNVTICVTSFSPFTFAYPGSEASYTVTWKNYDGVTLLTETLKAGETPAYSGTAPVKTGSEQYVYTFSGWTPAIAPVSGNVTYTAVFAAASRTYTISWDTDGDGNVNDTTNVAYGTVPAHDNGAKDGGYRFVSWTPALRAATSDRTYTAQFIKQYTVTWMNGENVLYSEQVDVNATPVYNGNTPTKEATAQYSYTFAGWDTTPAAVTGDVTYTAQFDSTVNQYTVKWIVDGTETTAQVEYGTVPAYEGTPAKAADAQYTYSFTGWDVTPVAVTGDVTYTAQFNKTAIVYTISYVLDGGTGSESNPASYTCESETITLVSPGKTGYTFTGWTDGNGEGVTQIEKGSTGDITLTANWTPIAVVGVSLDKEVETVEIGGEVTLTATVTPEDALDKTVTWTSGDEAIATVDNGVVTGVAAGEVTVTATANDGSGKKAECAITVTKHENAISDFSCGNITYGETPAPTAASTAGEVTFTYADAEDGTFGEWNAANNAGTWYVKATAAETAEYYGASATISFNVARAESSCGTATANTLTYSGSAQALVTAPAEFSGGTMVYSLSETGEYSSSIPTGTDAGSYTVYYKVAGDANHNDSAVQSVNVSIAKADATLTAPSAKTLTYNGNAQTLVNAASNVVGGTAKYSLSENGTYSTTAPNETNAGDYTVWYYVEGDSNHNSTQVSSVAVTINKANITIGYFEKPSAKTLTYTGSAQALATAPRSSTSGGTMVYSLSETGEYSSSIPTGTDAGTYKVYYKVAGDANHNDSAVANVSSTINKASVSVTAPTAKTLTYNGEAQTLVNAATNVVGGTVFYSSEQNGTYTADIPTGTNAGSYTVWYKVTGDANHNDKSAASVAASIGKAESSVGDASAITGLVYSGAAQTLVTAPTEFSGGSVVYSLEQTGTYTGTISTGTDAGDYTVYYKVAGDANHNDSAVKNINVNIAKAESSLGDAAAVTGLVYTGSAQALVNAPTAVGGTVVYSLTSDGEYTSSVAVGTDAGDYTVYYKVAGDANHNDSAVKSVEVSIGKATDVITLQSEESISSPFGETVTLPEASALFGTPEYVITKDEETVDGFDALGEYTVTWTAGEGTDNYNAAEAKSITVTIVVKTANADMVADIDDQPYTGEAIEPEIQVTHGETALVSGTDFDVEYADNVECGENTAKATVTFKGNYEGTVEKTFTIKAGATIDLVFPNTASYLYRVGNLNEVPVGKLFTVNGGWDISDVEVTTVSGASGAYNKDSKGIKFEGTGVVKLTAKAPGGEKELYLEVVNAYNATNSLYVDINDTAVSPTVYDAVMLNDIVNGDAITVSGHTLYGNGFMLKWTDDGAQGQNKVSNYKWGYVDMYSGTLENVQVVCKHFGASYGIVPGDNTTLVGDYYLYMRPAVSAAGNSTISNCYIYGARSNIYSISGNTLVRDTVCEAGAAANIQLWGSRDTYMTLENVTTIQYLKDGVYGFGILNGHNESSSNANITINGYLKQYNWISSADGIKNSYAKKIVNNALSETDYVTNGAINSGIISLNNLGLNITDNRDDADNYRESAIDMSGFTGRVYSVLASSNPTVEYWTEGGAHISTTNGYTVPTMTFTLPKDAENMSMTNGVVTLEFSADDLISGKQIDVGSMFTAVSRGKTLVPTITSTAVEDGTADDVADGKVTFKSAGKHNVVFTVSDDVIFDKDGVQTTETKTFSKTVVFNVSTVDNSIKNAEFEFDKTTQKFYYKTYNSLRSEYKQFIPILNGLKIYDYDKDNSRYKAFDFDNENANADAVIVRIDHANADQISTTTFYLKDGGALTMKYYTSADAHGSTYTTTIMRDSKGKIYAVNDGFTGATYDATSWEIIYYEYTGNNGKTVRYNVPSSLSNLLINTEGYKNGTIKTENAKDISDGRTNYYVNAGWGRDDISILDENGLPKNGVMFTGAGQLQLLKIATSTDVSGFYKYRYGYAATRNEVSFNEYSSDAHVVTFETNGENVISDKPYVLTSSTLNTSGTIGRSGFEFGGWYDQPIGGNKVGTQTIDGSTWTLSGLEVTSDTVLYAHWLKDVTVTFDTQGGNSVDAIQTKSSLAITMPEAGRENYIFKGWYDAAGNGDGTGATYFAAAGDTYYAPETDKKFYAHWDLATIEYDVTLNFNDGVTSNKTVTYRSTEGPLTLPSPTYAGTGGAKAKTFDGWYDGETKITSSTYSPTGNVILTAHWTTKTYTITLAGGNSKISGTFTYSDGRTQSWSNPGGKTSYSGVPYGTVKFTVTNKQNGSGDSSDYHLSEVKTSGLSTNVSWSNSSSGTNSYSGTFTLDANTTFTANRAADGGSCLAVGTLITLADGTQKPIEQITATDKVLAWSFTEGKYVEADIFSVTNHGEDVYNTVNMQFSDGTALKTIADHGLFDLTLNKFVNIDATNAQQYLGHSFVKYNNGVNESVTLTNVEIAEENTTAFSIISVTQLDVFANNMLALDPSIYFLFPFDVDENLKFDEEAMENDIATYGLLKYEDFKQFAPHMTENQFYAGCGPYINVALGKGIITMDEIINFANRLLVDQEILIP